MEWELYIDKPGKFKIAASYSYQGEETENRLNIRVSDTELNHMVEQTGKTVGEPKSEWVIDSFNAFHIGELKINSAGFYTLKLMAEIHGDPVQLNRVWIEKINKN